MTPGQGNDPEALRDALALADLPADVAALLIRVRAPPRLRAHLILVHDVARQLIPQLGRSWPQLRIDGESVLFGAATHDIGKADHPQELSGPGALHEESGQRTMIELGVQATRARFARTPAQWATDEAIALDDLFVALADNVWKGRRNDTLERLVVARLATAMALSPWNVFVQLDDILADIARAADARLAWQNQFAVVR